MWAVAETREYIMYNGIKHDKKDWSPMRFTIIQFVPLLLNMLFIPNNWELERTCWDRENESETTKDIV